MNISFFMNEALKEANKALSKNEVPIGGIIIDNGLMVEAKASFVACTANRRVMIKIICLEVMLGFSFLETNIKIPELISTSVKFKSQEKTSERFKGEIRSSL